MSSHPVYIHLYVIHSIVCIFTKLKYKHTLLKLCLLFLIRAASCLTSPSSQIVVTIKFAFQFFLPTQRFFFVNLVGVTGLPQSQDNSG